MSDNATNLIKSGVRVDLSRPYRETSVTIRQWQLSDFHHPPSAFH
jgi:hypothetical protein